MVAMLLGPSGVGLIGTYQTILSMLSTLAGLGIGNSGVRQIAEAVGTNDQNAMFKAAKVLRRVCWITGILGWSFTIAISHPLSMWVFGSNEKTLGLAILGITILLGAISSGQSALIQGLRRMKDLVAINISSVMLGTFFSVFLYAWLRERAIVPVIVVCSALNLAVCWWFSRKVKVVDIPLKKEEYWKESKALLTFGLAVMWSALLNSIVALITRSFIIREIGLDANGIYQAAWALSGLFAGFILGAMGTDFYPRITAVNTNHKLMNRMVNEQAEIGLLLCLPGLLATLSFSPLLLQLFYSAEFISGAPLFSWLILGTAIKIVSWPLGYILLAKGAARIFALSETVFSLANCALTLAMIRYYGLVGASYAYFILYVIYLPTIYFIVKKMTGFCIITSARRLILVSCAFVMASFLVGVTFQTPYNYVVGFCLAVGALIYALRGSITRLGPDHRVVKAALKIPLLKHLAFR